MEKSIYTLRLTGICFALIFLLFFIVGSFDHPITLEFKKADSAELFVQSKKITKPKARKVKLVATSLATEIDNSMRVELHSKKENIQPSPHKIHTPDGVERVLLIGDSQLEGLRKPVSSYCEKNNHVLLSTIIWYGSSTKQWATTDTLKYYLEHYQPTVVLFAIGLNELFVRDLESRAEYIRTIKKTFEEYNVRYSWIGPAAWTTDKGIIEVMKKEVGDYFFPSHTIKMERASDGRHPSKKAAKLWFDQVAETITKQGIINFETKVDTLTRLKFSRTILLKMKK
jgi:lysophospholipase L1-like esterase